MLLKSINLHNIRSYLDEKIVISEGTTLLAGDIGCGKSTILLAIEFALFGLSKGELSGSTLLRKGESECFVEVEFSLDNINYIISRSLKQSKTSITQDKCYLITNNEREDLAPIELKSKVLSLLGYPKDLLSKKNMIYRFTVYTPQEEMKRILFESNEDRMNTLRKVFGIDKYKRIRENSTILIKKLKEQNKLIEGIISDLPAKETQKKILEDNIIENSKELEPLDVQLQITKEKRIKQENIFKAIKEKCKMYTEHKQNVILLDNKLQNVIQIKQSLSKEIKQLSEELKVFTDIKEINPIEKIDIKNKIEELNKITTETKSKKNSIESNEKIILKQKLDLEEEITNIKSKITNKDELLNKKSAIEIKIKDKNEYEQLEEKLAIEIDSLKKELHILTSKIEDSKKTMQKVKDIDNCPTCLQKVSIDHKAHIVDNESERIEINKEKIDITSKSLDDKNKKYSNLKEKLKLIQKLSIDYIKITSDLQNMDTFTRQLEEKNHILEKTKEQLNHINEEKLLLSKINLEELNFQLKELNSKYESFGKIETQARLKQEKEKNLFILKQKNEENEKEIIKINSKKLELNKKSIEFNNIEELAEEKEKKLKQTELILKNIEIKQTELKTKIKSISEQRDLIKEEIIAKNNQQKRLFKKQQYVDWIENSFNNIVMIIEKNMMSSLYNEFNILFQEWFDVLIEDELITSKLDENFTPIIQQNGYDIEINNMSGGEKTALALAYRLALNKVINDITTQVKTNDILILDEPTDGFSDHQLDKIHDVLERLNMKQVIIVSHEEKIAAMVDRTIEITKSNHISKVNY